MYQAVTHGDVLVLTVAARQLCTLEAVARFEREVRQLLRERAERHWLIDFGNITFFITPTVNTLLAVLRTVQSRGGRLVLTGLSPDVKYVLGLMRVHNVLTVCPTVRAGLQILGATEGMDGAAAG
jgi:anti-anti-sigma factor